MNPQSVGLRGFCRINSKGYPPYAGAVIFNTPQHEKRQPTNANKRTRHA
jgi:hypothetical protein